MKKREFNFSLIIAGVLELTDDIVNALFDAGCDDATFGMRRGTLFAEYSRQSTSLKDAILSGIRDIKSAKVGAVVLRVIQSDLVSPAEIAKRSASLASSFSTTLKARVV